MTFPASITLSSLDGTNGFRLDGINRVDVSGRTVSGAGDFNGDGIDDFIIGASGGDPGGKTQAGESYLIFGSTSGFAPSISLASLDGFNGFRIDGISAYGFSGAFVAGAGDLNGDGFDDVIINAARNDSSYVLFGAPNGFSANTDLSSLDGTNGFRIAGTTSSGLFGSVVSSAGDINGDGFDDVIIGASGGDEGTAVAEIEGFVVFGAPTELQANFRLESLDGSNGFRIDGVDRNDQGSNFVSTAGDINDDGIDDFIIGVLDAAPEGKSRAGESYVVFGSTNEFAPTFDLTSLNGSNGFRIAGLDVDDRSGRSVAAAGDVNGDGIGDIVIGAFTADPYGRSNAGESYVIFGSDADFAAAFDLASLDGNNGFRITGIEDRDLSGGEVSSAGDINDDGFDDLLIAASSASPNGRSRAGESYVVFGSASGFDATLSLAELDGSNGFRIDGIDRDDTSGSAVSAAGDVNGDGVDDIVIGALSAEPNGRSSAGESYVLFGRSSESGLRLFGDFGSSVVKSNTLTLTLANISGAGEGGSYFVNEVSGGVLALSSAPDVAILNFTEQDLATNKVTFTPSSFAEGFVGFSVTAVSVVGDSSVERAYSVDVLENTPGADLLLGTAQADTLFGAGGADTVMGGRGRDKLSGGAGADQLFGEGGKDIVLGNGGKDTLDGGRGRDDLNGGGGRDHVLGSGGRDTLDGGGGKDTIQGGNGRDDIFGGRGADQLTGNGGSDRFIFDRGNGRDTITDFDQGRDKIVILGGAKRFSDLQIAQVGDDVRIQIANSRVIVENDQIENFTAFDFIF